MLKPRAGRERKRKKNEPIEQASAIDWTEMQSVVKNASSDSRRPVGNNTSALPSRYQVDEKIKEKAEASGSDIHQDAMASVKRTVSDIKTSGEAEKAGTGSEQRPEKPAVQKGAAATDAQRASKAAPDAGAATAGATISAGRMAAEPVKATPIIPAAMPGRGVKAEPDNTGGRPVTMREQMNAEKNGRQAAQSIMYEPDDYDEDEDEEDDDDEGGFSFFRRNKQKVPKKVSQREAKRMGRANNGRQQPDAGYGYDGQMGQGGPSGYPAQGYDQGYGQGYMNQGYDQGYQGQGYDQGYGQGYMDQGYDRNYQGQGYGRGYDQSYGQDYGYGQDYQNRGYDQGYGQGYMNQGYDRNYQGQGYDQGYPVQGGYDQGAMQYQEYPQQQMYNTSDFDEDFEFNFIDVN